MDIRIFADDLKSAVRKVGTAIPKKSSFPALQSARITAKDGVITLSATDIENYVAVEFNGLTIENGFVDIEYDDLKNITGINGEVAITYDSESGFVNFRSPKKSYTVAGNDWTDRLPDEVSVNASDKVSIPAEILANLKPLCAMAHKETGFGLMNGIHFDMKNSAIVALDGRRFGMWDLSLYDIGEADSFTAPIVAENILKTLIGKCDKRISILVGEKYTQFIGEDFSYICRNIDGKYFDYRKMINDYPIPSNIFSANGKEVAEIAKEYKKLLSKDDSYPMIFTVDNNVVCSGIHARRIKTTDVIESATVTRNSEYFYAGFKPEYILDGINFCGNDIVVKATDSSKKPIIITDKFEEKITFILPVNMGDPNAADFVRKQGK